MQTRGSANILGIDISSYETITDQTKLFQTSPNFIYLRCFGSNHSAIDSTFVQRAQMYTAQGIPSGGYYFCTPSTPITSDGGAESNAQCDQFIAGLQQGYGSGKFGDLIPFIDIESWGSVTPQYPMYYGITGDQLIDWIKNFRDRFYSKTNRRLGIYAGRYFMTDPSQMNISSTKLNEINDMPLWYADYDIYRTTSSNAYPTSAQMTANAQYILNFLTSFPYNWTAQAVCGMLGNMQTESQINPGVWQNLDATNTSGGFGLVQWTPSTTLTNWANNLKLDPKSMYTQLRRIIYELENGLQFYPSSYSSMTFKQYIASTDTPANLAYVWLNNYERPANRDQPDRQTQATNWFNTLDFKGLDSPPAFGGWSNYVLWQYSMYGRASAYGISQSDDQMDLDRTDSIDNLKPPPPPTNIVASQPDQNTFQVTFTRPAITDYLGTSLYVNGTWKKWSSKTATSDIFTLDVTDTTVYPRSTDMTYQLVVEDTYSDFGYSAVFTTQLAPATAPAPTPTPVTTDPTTTTPTDPSAPVSDPTPTPVTDPTAPPITIEGADVMPTVSMGTQLKKGTTVIALLTSIDGLNLKSDTVETTALDTAGGYKTFLSTTKDAGEVSIGGHFDYTAHGDFLNDFEAMTIQAYTIEFPDAGPTGVGTTWNFSAVVTDYHTSVDLGSLIKFEATLKVSGKPTLAGPL
jgi:GH25 family lysozyme M1 (1,4-beta-N-acetylmuramidase)/predicted secreted protein